jgi:hypothetical protein
MKILLDLPEDLTQAQLASTMMDFAKAFLFFEDTDLQMDGAVRVETEFGACFAHLLDDEEEDNTIIPFQNN